MALVLAAGNDFSFVISFDQAKEITFCFKVRQIHKNIALRTKMRT
jgi:hypothetical protein